MRYVLIHYYDTLDTKVAHIPTRRYPMDSDMDCYLDESRQNVTDKTYWAWIGQDRVTLFVRWQMG